MSTTAVDVFLDTPTGTELVGRAHFTRARRQISTTFLYDAAYLASDGMAIDPALPLVAGAQHQRGLIGAFADSVPDRWGRNLLEKIERTQAHQHGRAPRRLDEVDFLLGVSDDTRQGALRFRLAGGDEFLGAAATVPPLISLPRLLHASAQLVAETDPAAAVKQLLNTGTTGLGGARPKASVRLEDGSLAIAKFPHHHDQWDVMAWEATALDVLAAAGIQTPLHRLVRVSDQSVLLLRRFDRTVAHARIGYISAIATGSTDGAPRDYADIAAAIRDLSLSPKQDHRRLFDRATANVILANVDDHLRNHGFLARRGSWELSPVFDVNPTPPPQPARATSIMGAETFPDEVDGLMALAEECGLSAAQAQTRMGQVARALAQWQDAARRNRIPEAEITMMEASITPRLTAVAQAGRS